MSPGVGGLVVLLFVVDLVVRPAPVCVTVLVILVGTQPLLRPVSILLVMKMLLCRCLMVIMSRFLWKRLGRTLANLVGRSWKWLAIMKCMARFLLMCLTSFLLMRFLSWKACLIGVPFRVTLSGSKKRRTPRPSVASVSVAVTVVLSSISRIT